MAPKRKPLSDGEMESPADSPKPKDDMTEFPADFAEPVYLVAAREDEKAAYTVFKIDATAVTSGNTPPRAQIVAGLSGTEHGMSFVAAHSKHGSWIVAVGGGLRSGTIIFDPSTLRTYRGPRLMQPKDEPVLISHGGEVYALSRSPRVVPHFDFYPWFETLSFNKGVPSIDCGVRACWSPLSPPPFFPSSLDPYEFRNPPKIVVSSYAAVGSHILLSPQPELRLGTYAFHVVNKTWEKVHDENLPFVDQAVPVGGSLYAAYLTSDKASAGSASLFYMSINTSQSTHDADVSTTSLSIQEFPVVASMPKVPRPLFCPLGKGKFCFIRLGPCRRSHKNANLFKEVEVVLTTFQTENIDAILSACHSQSSTANNLRVALQVKEQSHSYNSKGRSRMLYSDIPVVAALSIKY
ncbi:unnamed protein product [Urochloa decumbens]|uniref:Uncharacterized protein n=1 Tax=Urochloa decumbens TaxID=240449 RepID=A0ABC8ZAS3_9POAL